MKKEILTKEKMKSDILPLLLGDIAGSVVAYIFLLLIGTFVILFLRSINVTVKIGFILLILLIVLTTAFLLCLTYLLILIYKVHKLGFIIKTDTLVGKKEGGGHPGTTGWTGYRPYALNFAVCHKFNIPAKMNYKWSLLYSMDEKGIFNSSNLNDQFILVSLNGKKIIMAYNLKMFDFQKQNR